MVGQVSCPKGGSLSVEVISSKSKVKGKLADGKPAIDVELRIEANVGEVACRVDLTKTKTIEQLEQASNQVVKGFIETSIKKMQKEYKTDIYGFGQAVHRAEPKLWKRIGKNWGLPFCRSPCKREGEDVSSAVSQSE